MADHVRIVSFLGDWGKLEPRHYEHAASGVGTTKDACLPHEVWLKWAMRLLAEDRARTGQGRPTTASAEGTTAIDLARVSLIFVGTEKAGREVLGPRGRLVAELGRWLGAELAAKVPVAFLRYDEAMLRGADSDAEKEFWRYFQRMTEVLSPRGVVGVEGLTVVQGDAGCFDAAPAHVVLDITHGFRAASFVAGSALDFALIEGRAGRLHDPDVEPRPAAVHHVVYAAADDVDAGAVVPLWNLTRFAAAARWGSALDAMMRYGRADEVADLTHEEVVRSGDPAWAAFGDAAKGLADNIACNRWQGLLTGDGARIGSAQGMIDAIDGARGSLEARMPVLRPTLDRLKGWAQPLVAKKIHAEEGVRALARLASLQEKLQRYLELAATLREGLVTLYAVRSGRGDAAALEPGSVGFKGYRDALENALQAAKVKAPPSGAPTAKAPPVVLPASSGPWAAGLSPAASGFVTEMFQRRNDLLHSGLNEAPMSADALRAFLTTARGTFDALMREDDPKDAAE